MYVTYSSVHNVPRKGHLVFKITNNLLLLIDKYIASFHSEKQTSKMFSKSIILISKQQNNKTNRFFHVLIKVYWLLLGDVFSFSSYCVIVSDVFWLMKFPHRLLDVSYRCVISKIEHDFPQINKWRYGESHITFKWFEICCFSSSKFVSTFFERMMN